MNADTAPFQSIAQTPTHKRIDHVRPLMARALAALQAGELVCVVEDVGAARGVFAAMASRHATPERVNDLVARARGIVAATLLESRADALDLAEISRRQTQPWTPRYAVSVEAARGVSTGISAADRAATILALADGATTAADLVRPGHIMPVRVPALGCLRRPYGCEAAHDLIVLAGLEGGATVSHVIDGMSEVGPDQADAYAARHGWPVLRVSDVMVYRATEQILVRSVSEGVVQTAQGDFLMRVYENDLDRSAHVALLPVGTDGAVRAPAADHAALVRIHSQCLTGDVLGSMRCDCGEQLRQAMARINAEGHGALVYLSQEGRGIGLTNKIRAYALQDEGVDTVEANVQLGFPPDLRDYAVAGQILRHLGLLRVRLLTNNPEKVAALQHLGVEVLQRVAIEAEPSADNRRYLQTKRDRMGHMLERLGG